MYRFVFGCFFGLCVRGYSYVHWYGIFYLGISEVSSIPLVIVDVFKYFPDVAARLVPVLQGRSRGRGQAFVVSVG